MLTCSFHKINFYSCHWLILKRKFSRFTAFPAILSDLFHFILFQISPVEKTSQNDVSGHLVRSAPHKQSCLEKARPSPPDPVVGNLVVVNKFTIDPNNRLFLNFSWELPDATYGNVSAYQVRVLHMPVSSSGVVASSNIIVEKEFISVSKLRLNTVKFF